MRHRVDHRKLGRTASHRKAMLSNMVTSLFDKERITTTAPKAKEARRSAERLVTRAKKGYVAYQKFQSLKESGSEAEAKQKQAEALAHWRQAARVIRDKDVLKKLFESIAPLYLDREGGYTRILRIGNRLGDNAESVMLELVGTEVTSEPKLKKKAKKEEAQEGEEAAADAKEEKKDKKAEAKDKKADKEKKAAAEEEPVSESAEKPEKKKKKDSKKSDKDS